MISVADLVTKLHSNIDQIHTTIALISDTSDHDAEITRLEKERDEQLQQLEIAHESAIKEGEEARLREEQEIEEQIKREEEEIAERRRREDEERKLRIESAVKEREKVRQEEEEKRKVEFENRHKRVEDGVDEEMERLEDELEKRMTHGQKALEDLDAARREINRQIDQQLNVPTVLPKIQYKSRKKAVLNSRQPDIPSEKQEVRELKEDDRNNLDTNENSSRDANEHKDEEAQDNRANIVDNEAILELEPLQKMEMQPSSPSAEEVVHREQELRSPEVEHVEEISKPIEETTVSIPEERHVEPDVAQKPEHDPLLENYAQEHAQEIEQDVAKPVVVVSKEINDVYEAHPKDARAISDVTSKDQTEEAPSVEISQNEIIEASSEESEVSDDYTGESRTVEIIPEIVEDGLSQDHTSIQIPKEVETSSPYDQNESPADREAREEIAKLNEEIRRAMEEEAAGAMIPHEEARDLTYDTSEEESNRSEPIHARDVVKNHDFANEAAAEKKDITKDGLPEIGSPKSPKISEVPAENEDIEPNIPPETAVAENALENEVASESNETDDKEVLGPEEQVKSMTQDLLQTTPQVPPVAEKPSSEQTLHIDSTLENQGSSESNKLIVDESPDQTTIDETDEKPVDLREMPVSPAMTNEESIPGNLDHGIVEAEDESLAKKFSSSANQEAASHVKKEPAMVPNDLESVYEDEPTTLSQSELEEMQTAVRKSSEAETIQLNESPLQSEHLSENQLEIDPSQEQFMEIVSAEDKTAEKVPKLAETFDFTGENAPTTTGENITGEDPLVSSLAENELEAKTKEVVSDEDPTEQNKKQSETDFNKETKFEDNDNSRSKRLSESRVVSQSILDEAGETKDILDENFSDSEQTSEVVDSGTETHGDHISPTDSQITTDNHIGMNDITVPTQEEHHFKDDSIDNLTNSALHDNSNLESELLETRDVTLSDMAQDMEVAVEPVVTIIEQVHDDQEDLNVISKSDEVEAHELETSLNKSVLKDEDSNDSEQIPETIDESIQLPGHIKHPFDETLVTHETENEDSSKNEPVITEQEESVSGSLVPDTEIKDSKITDQEIDPSLDVTLEGLQPNTAEADAPDPQESEGVEGVSLNLNVGSPLPSPTHQKVTINDGEKPQLESDSVENRVNLEEMGEQEEDSKVDDSTSPQDIRDVEALSSIQIQPENKAPREVIKTPEDDVPTYQEEGTFEKINGGTSPENPELHEIKKLLSTSVEEPVKNGRNLDDAEIEEDAIHAESQNDEIPKVETIPVPDSPIIGPIELPITAGETHYELDRESESGKDGMIGNGADGISLQSPVNEDERTNDKEDAHTGDLGGINHTKGPEITDTMMPTPSSITSVIPEYTHNIKSTEGTELSTGSEEIHIDSPLQVTTTSPATVQPQQVPYEDPEDVRAREEITRLNEEFMKAIEEEQADEDAKDSLGVDTVKDIKHMEAYDPAGEEKQAQNSQQSTEYAVSKEEISLLNEQMESPSQKQEDAKKTVETEEKKEENHEVSAIIEAQTLEQEQPSVHLDEAYKDEEHAEEHIPDTSNSLVHQSEKLNTSDQSGKITSEEKSDQSITDEISEDVEIPQHVHEHHGFQDSDSEGEETELLSESENEWDHSVVDEEKPLAFLETIHEESHDEGVSHIGENTEDEDEDEEIPKSRFFHPHWKYEDMNDDGHPKQQGANKSSEAQESSSRSLSSELISAPGFSHNPQYDQHHVEPSVFPAIDHSETEKHSSTSVPEAEQAEHNSHDELEHPSKFNNEVSKPQSIKRPQTPMQLVPVETDDNEILSPHTINGTNQSFDDKNLEATHEDSSHYKGAILPRVLEPSPIIEESNSNPGKSEEMEQKSMSQIDSLAPEAGPPRRPKSLYHRNSDLSPEHEAVFSRVSQIRSSLVPSPEPNHISNGALSPRSRSERFPPDEHRNYLDVSINNTYNGWGYSNISDDDQLNDYRTYLNTDIGRDRSHTVDTVPSFEHYASDDGESGPPTPPQQPQYSDPVSQQQPHISQMLAPEFQSSEGWSLTNDDTHDDSTNQEENHDDVVKSPNPQEAVEFDSLNPQEYKSPIPSPVKSSFNVGNVHVEREDPPTSLSNPPSLLPPDKILGSNAPALSSGFTPQTPSASTQVDEKPTSQLPQNLRSVPWTQSEDPYKTSNQEKENASPQRKSRPVSSIFARTRSLFESAGSNDSNSPPKQRPLSGMSIFNVSQPSRSTPSPAPVQTRPHSQSISSFRSVSSSKRSSLHLSESVNTNADYDPNTDAEFLPKSLDGDGRLPSPVFGLPGHRSSGSFDNGRDLHGDEDDPYYTQKGSRASGSWVGGFTGMSSRGAMAEGEPLLRDGN
ncbi:hypothetical protein MFRU_011g02680 [Monilinia fructicola]|nr:hypothetical protein MFRU_011g02680 [Monilinia fructicola]